MVTPHKIDLLYEKVSNDMLAIQKIWMKKKKEEIIKQVYWLYLRENFYECFDYIFSNAEDGCDIFNFPLSDSTVEKILAYEGNILDFITANFSCSVRHIDRYNINDFDGDVPAIIEATIALLPDIEEQNQQTDKTAEKCVITFDELNKENKKWLN